MSYSMSELEAERKLTFGKLLMVSDEISRTVLTVFDYRPSVKRVANTKKMTSSKFTIEILETCAKFLNIPVQDEHDVALYSNKDPLATRIVDGIEALFPSHCAACKTDYSTEFDREVKDDKEDADQSDVIDTLSCYRCFQESHTCDQQNDALKALKELGKTSPLPTGMVWLCHECTAELNPIIPPKRKRLNTAGGTQSVPGTPNPGTPTNGRTNEQDNVNKVAPDKNLLDKSELSKALREAADKSSGLERESKQTQRLSYNTVTSTKVCPKYLTRNCPHGRSGTIEVDGDMCQFVHPKLCRRYCEDGNDRRYGCTRRRCLYYHPKLCWNSTERRHCPDESCPFTHLRGTTRDSQDPTQRERARPREERNGYGNRCDNDAATRPRNTYSRHDGPTRRRKDTVTQESGEDRQKDNQTERRTAPQLVTHEAAQENKGMSHADFLQLMGLVTSMQGEFKRVATTQDEFRKEMANIKLNLNNVSLATQRPSAEHMISSQYMPQAPPMLNLTSYPMPSSQPGPGAQQYCY